MVLLTLTVAPLAACALSRWLGRRGLNRLQHDIGLPEAASWIAGTFSAAIGVCLTWPQSQGGQLGIGLTVLFGVFFALLAVAAVVDWKTKWAPTELMLPICLIAGVYSTLPPPYSQPALGVSALTGIALMALAWGFWAIQVRLKAKCLPPADAISLALPTILLERIDLIVTFYLALSAALMLVRLAERSSRIRVTSSNGEIPLLAFAFPTLLICLCAEALL